MCKSLNQSTSQPFLSPQLPRDLARYPADTKPSCIAFQGEPAGSSTTSHERHRGYSLESHSCPHLRTAIPHGTWLSPSWRVTLLPVTDRNLCGNGRNVRVSHREVEGNSPSLDLVSDEVGVDLGEIRNVSCVRELAARKRNCGVSV
jgi:hypothetical protein